MPNPALSPEIQQAMQRRQQGQPTPALNQVSPQAPTSNPVPQPMNSSEMNKASSPQGTPAPQQPKWQPQTQDDLIVSALIEKMNNNDKLKKEQLKMSQQPMPMGGGYPQKKSTSMGGGFNLSPGFQQPMSVNQMQSDYAGGLGKDYSGLSNYGQGGF